MRRRPKGYIGLAALGLTALCVWQVHAWATGVSGLWPSFFLNWDSGGRSPHIRHHQPGGIVRNSQGSEQPIHAGHWVVRWMKPEPMHAIDSVDNNRAPGEQAFVRVEIKVGT